MKSRLPAIWIGWVGVVVLFAACSAANRAAVHDDDMKKVFPWPRGKQSVSIQVKPMTTMAKTCLLFGSFREVEVTPDTTFYLVTESEKNFAYTPSRSPIRRLAKIKSMEILWPQKEPEKKDDKKDDKEGDKKDDKEGDKKDDKEDDKEAPQPKQ